MTRSGTQMINRLPPSYEYKAYASPPYSFVQGSSHQVYTLRVEVMTALAST